MNLLYITCGANASIHSQAAFSIYSFLSCKAPVHSINIITDAPEYYHHLRNKATIIPVNDALLQDWKGPHNFFWRIKIKAIEQICAQYAGQPVVYLDTDTFLYGAHNQLQQLLAAGCALMHENEGRLHQQKAKTARLMHRQINHRSFGGLNMQDDACMWNAG